MATKLTYLHGFFSTELDIFLFYLKRQCSDAEYWGFFVHVSLLEFKTKFLLPEIFLSSAIGNQISGSACAVLQDSVKGMSACLQNHQAVIVNQL